MDRLTDWQTDNIDIIGPSVGCGSDKDLFQNTSSQECSNMVVEKALRVMVNLYQ